MKYGYLCIGLILIFSCGDKNGSELSIARNYYDDLIFNLAMAHPDYGCISCFAGPQEECNYLKESILLKRKEIKDKDLHIYLAFHRWTNYGGDFPKSIVYISHDAGFEHAFPFFDEYYYSSDKKKGIVHTINTFGDQINFVIRQLNWQEYQRKGDVNKLITLMADSLLGMKEYSTRDTSEFRIRLEEDLEYAGSNRKSCNEMLRFNVQKMVKDAANPNVRFFKCREGEFGFWKLQIDTINGILKINSTFENSECYSVMRF